MLYKVMIPGVLICLFLMGCDVIWPTYTGIVYPDKNDLSQSENVGVYPSLDECRDASHTRLVAINAVNSGDYECGKNCYKDNPVRLTRQSQ